MVTEARTPELLSLPPRDLARLAIGQINDLEVEHNPLSPDTIGAKAIDNASHVMRVVSLPAVQALMSKTNRDVELFDTQPSRYKRFVMATKSAGKALGEQFGLRASSAGFNLVETYINPDPNHLLDPRFDDPLLARERPVALNEDTIKRMWNGDQRAKTFVKRLSRLTPDRSNQKLKAFASTILKSSSH